MFISLLLCMVDTHGCCIVFLCMDVVHCCCGWLLWMVGLVHGVCSNQLPCHSHIIIEIIKKGFQLYAILLAKF